MLTPPGYCALSWLVESTRMGTITMTTTRETNAASQDGCLAHQAEEHFGLVC